MRWKLIVTVGYTDIEYDCFDTLQQLSVFAETVVNGKTDDARDIKVKIVPSEREVEDDF